MHKNDIYEENAKPREEGDEDVQPAIPAATVILLRDGADGVETLMLKKNSDIAFGGMWVFPGGKIDADDRHPGDDADMAAQRAAVREAEEEAALNIAPSDLVFFSHWTPPPAPRKRFATWFFATAVEHTPDVVVDQGEITDHVWIRPGDALARHAAREIDIVPPTWVTLYHLSQESPAGALVERLRNGAPRIYQTRVSKDADGERVAMWTGDAGYDAWDGTQSGARHRLVMSRDGFRFENDAVAY